MRRLDRILAGLAMMVSGQLLLGLLAALAIEGGEEDYRRRIAEGRPLYVDGNVIGMPRGVAALTGAAVMADGTLNPNHTWWFGNYDDPAQLWFHRVEGRAKLPQSKDYGPHYGSSVHHLSRGDSDQWIWARRLGIVRLKANGDLEGTLTDEGWVPGRRAPSSFNQAYAWFPTHSYSTGTHERFLLYVTQEGIYRADLEARGIVRVADLSEPAFLLGAFPQGPGAELSDCVLVVTPTRIRWVELKESGRSGEIVRPAFLAETSDAQIGVTISGRLVFRGEVPGSQTATSVSYRVAVVDRQGTLLDSYRYDLRLPQGARFISSLQVERDKVEHVAATFWGRLTSTLFPVAWRSVPAFVRWRWGEPEAWRQGLMLMERLGSSWLILPLPLILAGFVVWRSRRQSGAWWIPMGWGAFVLVFGLPAALTYWVLAGRPTSLENCPLCGRMRAKAVRNCEKCGSSAAHPVREGIEIFDPA